MALKIRRGTNAERAVVTFAEGELVYVTDTDELYVGDGSTLGGVRLAGSALSSIGTMLSADTISDELDLQRNLNLSGNNIIGTGNINISGDIHASGNITAGGNIDIGDNSNDTLTIVAQVDSNITPTSDTTYDLGATNARWRNGYFTGLTIDGSIDAVTVNADVVADNSTVMVDVSTNTFTGNLTGDLTGNVSGNLTGNVSGNVTGNLTGNVEGDLIGSVFADDSTTLVDAVAGVLRGEHVGSLTGNVKAPNGSTILNVGTNGLDASIVATVVGNVSGNLTGNVTGNITGNSTGFHTGDVKGSVFADNSTVLVDAVAGIIPGAVISGTITANLVGDVSGNLQGNVTGDVTGNIFTNSIDSADSSAIVVTPALRTLSDLIVDQGLIIGPDPGVVNLFGPETPIVRIVPGAQNEGGLIRGGEVFTDSLTVKRIRLGEGDVGSEIEVNSNIAFFEDVSFDKGLLSLGNTSSIQFPGDDRRLSFATFTGDIGVVGALDDLNNYDFHFKVTKDTAEFGVPVKFPSFTTTERDALTAEVGMVIFNTTDTKLQVCTVGGVTPTWVDMH